MGSRRWISRLTTTLLLAALTAVAPPATSATDDTPDAGQVAELLQARLDRDFRKGLFRVGDTELRASVPYEAVDDGSQRVRVFYRTELRFMRAHQLSGWDSLNVGSLIWVLGTTPRNIQGVRPDGNAKGDRLHVVGSTSFVHRDESWEPVANEARMPAEPEAATAPSEPRPSYRERQLLRIEELGDELEQAEMAGGARYLRRELDRVIADVESRLAGKRGLLRLATGVSTGEYRALGDGLRAAVNADTERLYTVRSSGSAANCALVEAGTVEAALSQNDIAYMAYHGQGLFQDTLPMEHLRALASVYPEAMHLVTVAGSGIETVADLAGRAVDVGPDDSGIRVNAAQLLAAAGLTLESLDRVQGSPVDAALDDLVRGQVDAVFLTGAYPYPELAAHAARADLRLVSLSDAVVETLWSDAPFMLPLTIPAHTYPGQQRDVKTVGVTALLVARDDLADVDVERLMNALFGGGEVLREHSAQAYFISRETADRGLSIPLHPAARRFLEGAD